MNDEALSRELPPKNPHKSNFLSVVVANMCLAVLCGCQTTNQIAKSAWTETLHSGVPDDISYINVSPIIQAHFPKMVLETRTWTICSDYVRSTDPFKQKISIETIAFDLRAREGSKILAKIEASGTHYELRSTTKPIYAWKDSPGPDFLEQLFSNPAFTQDELAKLSQNGPSGFRSAATARLRDQTILTTLAETSSDSGVRASAAASLEDHKLLAKMALTDGDTRVRLAAVSNPHLTDRTAFTKVLGDYFKDGDTPMIVDGDYAVASTIDLVRAAATRLLDQSSIETQTYNSQGLSILKASPQREIAGATWIGRSNMRYPKLNVWYFHPNGTLSIGGVGHPLRQEGNWRQDHNSVYIKNDQGEFWGKVSADCSRMDLKKGGSP
jgi:hypothetical protein